MSIINRRVEKHKTGWYTQIVEDVYCDRCFKLIDNGRVSSEKELNLKTGAHDVRFTNWNREIMYFDLCPKCAKLIENLFLKFEGVSNLDKDGDKKKARFIGCQRGCFDEDQHKRIMRERLARKLGLVPVG